MTSLLLKRVKNTYQAQEVIINAAGVYADNIANLISKATFTITPRKGSYFVIDHLASPLVNSVVFPFPFLLRIAKVF